MIGGRWAVVSLERPQGAAVDRLTPFTWHPEAEHELAQRRRDSSTPKLLGLAACAACRGSDDGCEVCNPDGEPPISAGPDARQASTPSAVEPGTAQGTS